MNYFLRWEGKDTNEKFIKGEIAVESKIAEPLLSQLVILKVGKEIIKQLEKKDGVQ